MLRWGVKTYRIGGFDRLALSAIAIDHRNEVPMPIFQCHGPFDVPTYNGKAAKIVDSERLTEFWNSASGLSEKRGCYVFAVRAGKGFRPL